MMDTKGVKTSPKIGHAEDAIWTEGWSEERENGGLPTAGSVLDGEKKIMRQTVFICIRCSGNCHTHVDCTNLTDTAPLSAADA